MYKLLLLLVVLIVVMTACSRDSQENAFEDCSFKLPVIIQPPIHEADEFFKAESLEGVWFNVVGKYKFTDSLRLENKIQRDSLTWNDFSWDGAADPFNIDTLGSDGFQLFVDYNSTIAMKLHDYENGNLYYPVYLVNESSRTKLFWGKDGGAFGLQEAIDTSLYFPWRPIESRPIPWCGVGHFSVKVHPGEFILLLAKKYAGDESQLMRARVKIGETIYISQAFEGRFNRKQFGNIEAYWMSEIFNEDRAYAVINYFYGSIPKDFDVN